MIPARLPSNERARLATLLGYELLDTEAEEAFDSLTRVVASLCRVPIAMVSLIDEHRQWFKSQCGLGSTTSTSRDISFCGHAILQSEIFEVPDTHNDPRFVDNPLVTGDPYIRFYAGMPLIEPGGMALGTLCIIDRKPRKLTKAQRATLADIASSVVGLIRMRMRRSELEEYRQARVQNDEAGRRLHEHTIRLEALANGRIDATHGAATKVRV